MVNSSNIFSPFETLFIEFFLVAVDLTKDCHREILELDIPLDAEPGLLHYNSEGTLKFEFDKVFNSNTSQDDIFEEIAKDKIRDALDGVNCTIFAYGQTGSGKVGFVLLLN